MRIVSLIASATEMVCALGMEDQLVGRSHECDYPVSIRELPVCSRAKLRMDAPGAAMDREVKEILEQALSVYHVDAAMLRALRPTHILTQTQCEVCAVSLKEVEQALGAWIEDRPQIVPLQPFALSDLWTDIERVGGALGVPGQGRELICSLQARMTAIADSAAGLSRPDVACIEWIEPLMAAGNWMPELVEMAGGRNLFGAAGRHAPWLDWESVVAADAEVMLMLPCGFGIPRIRQELPALAGKAEWNRLKSVREGRVFLVDGNQYFNRPGPRLADSLEILAEILHPEAFSFGHQGSGWEPL